MIPYAELIQLDQIYIPAQPSGQDNNLQKAIDALLDDPASQRFIQQYRMPATNQEKRRWLQASLTMRPPGELSQALCEATDRLLQQELTTKHITEACKLPYLDIPSLNSGKISIWNGDIATLKIDAITNAANAQMLGCFQPFHACIDNVIQCAAGPQLREDCFRIMEFQGHDEHIGSAKITRGYNLPANFVLHTVGPIITNRQPSLQQSQQLASCYNACLQLAATAKVRSIALCGISTGVFGYPLEQAAEVAIKTVIDWLQHNPGTLDQVVFNTFGEHATRTYHQVISRYQ